MHAHQWRVRTCGQPSLPAACGAPCRPWTCARSAWYEPSCGLQGVLSARSVIAEQRDSRRRGCHRGLCCLAARHFMTQCHKSTRARASCCKARRTLFVLSASQRSTGRVSTTRHSVCAGRRSNAQQATCELPCCWCKSSDRLQQLPATRRVTHKAVKHAGALRQAHLRSCWL